MSSETHFTTRRSFIAAMGFGGVGLYGLWAAYGAAPGPLALLGIGGDHGDMASVTEPGGEGDHGGHGAGAGGPTPEEFKRMVTDFVERYSLPDGTVHPRSLASPTALLSAADSHEVTDHGDHGTMDHAASEAPADIHDGHDDSAAHVEEGERLDVLVSAGKWYYLPDKLRLDAGRPYRFRMMALDVSHGASIQFGNGGRMVRLRPGRLTDMDITFEKPGRYLIHCTVYCGAAHDLMQATIEVA